MDWNEDAIAAAREIRIDSHVLAFTLLLSTASAVLFGLVPAIRAARRDVGTKLKEGARISAGGPSRHRPQRVLVIGEVALSLFLLAGAGLFVDQFIEELQASIGFNSRNLLTATVWLRGVQYFSAQRQRQFSENLQQELTGLPQVGAAALSTDIPFDFPGEIHFTVEATRS